MALFGKAIFHKWANLLSVFTGFYGIIITLANFRLNGIYGASDEACYILLIGMVSFFIAYILVVGLYQHKDKRNRLFYHHNIDMLDGLDSRYEIRKPILYLLLIFVLIYALWRFSTLLLLLRSGYSYIQIRTIYFNSQNMFDSSVASRYGRNRLDVYLFQPALLLLMIMSCVVFFTKIFSYTQKQKIRFTLLVFLCTALTAASNGGREIIFYFILMFAFAYFALRKSTRARGEKFNLTKKQKRYIRVALIVALVAMVVMTFRRSTTGESTLHSLLNTVYLYFSGWLPHFSLRLNALKQTDYTLGYAFIMGLIKLPAAVLHRLLGVPVSNAFSVAEALTSNLQNRVDIGGGYTFNAFVSPFYYFFADYGYVSLIIEAFLFGVICAISERNFKRQSSYLRMIIYLFCFFLCISSMVRWEMIHPKTAMMLYLIPLLVKKRKYKR